MEIVSATVSVAWAREAAAVLCNGGDNRVAGVDYPLRNRPAAATSVDRIVIPRSYHPIVEKTRLTQRNTE